MGARTARNRLWNEHVLCLTPFWALPLFSIHIFTHITGPLLCLLHPLGLSFSSLTILFSYLLFTCTDTHMFSRDRWKNRIEGSQSPSSINRTRWGWVGGFCLGHWRNLTPVDRITNTRQKLSRDFCFFSCLLFLFKHCLQSPLIFVVDLPHYLSEDFCCCGDSVTSSTLLKENV